MHVFPGERGNIIRDLWQTLNTSECFRKGQAHWCIPQPSAEEAEEPGLQSESLSPKKNKREGLFSGLGNMAQQLGMLRAPAEDQGSFSTCIITHSCL